jgi:hypothetical protein
MIRLASSALEQLLAEASFCNQLVTSNGRRVRWAQQLHNGHLELT